MIKAEYAVVIVTYNREVLLRECVSQVEKQTVPASKIIVVNNASTDGTTAYLEALSKHNGVYHIIECSRNLGGAGGFARGLACAMNYSVDCVLLIDDDAMLSVDYMEKLLMARDKKPQYGAFAGCVQVDGKLDTNHRKNFSKVGMLFKNCREALYQNDYFVCETASFCGMLVDKIIIDKIGLPNAEYFILHDDVEYSIRINQLSKFLVVSNVILHHKTERQAVKHYPRRYDWHDYYAVRNRIWYVMEHGTVLDRLVNGVDLFLRVIFRNWVFGLIKRDGYDWQYEKAITKAAIKDAHVSKEKKYIQLKIRVSEGYHNERALKGNF